MQWDEPTWAELLHDIAAAAQWAISVFRVSHQVRIVK
jgi:hypothetical protein